MSDIDVAKASFDAYRRQDADAMLRVLSPDYRFTSPQDDHIDRDAFMERCFPTADRFSTSTVLELVSTPTGVLYVYEYELTDGGRYRNVELIRVEGDQLVETQVFFGGQVG
ncbi:nuclear transport factor 2 family protein [Glaciihabitans arcticus]|uniref:Nuclear transport factor 2 family protein n=1 Tax=Glaciihabitans arcticus TaxID=2668039 RepID=A0A4Q9GTK4_9MICO|nr:nuclear transport factor 2 family protein [Glaciihabitans arcticus]TBN58396.1 nuclear transport factor 2 family protein [Glaciihabitans arcticus]